MTDPPSDLSSGADPLDAIVSGYLESLQAGEKIDRFQILAEHPEDGQEIIRTPPIATGPRRRSPRT